MTESRTYDNRTTAQRTVVNGIFYLGNQYYSLQITNNTSSTFTNFSFSFSRGQGNGTFTENYNSLTGEYSVAGTGPGSFWDELSYTISTSGVAFLPPALRLTATLLSDPIDESEPNPVVYRLVPQYPTISASGFTNAVYTLGNRVQLQPIVLSDQAGSSTEATVTITQSPAGGAYLLIAQTTGVTMSVNSNTGVHILSGTISDLNTALQLIVFGATTGSTTYTLTLQLSDSIGPDTDPVSVSLICAPHYLCFAKHTMIRLADGHNVPVQSILPGMMLADGLDETATHKVMFVTHHKYFRFIEFAPKTFGPQQTRTLAITSRHLIHDNNAHCWKEARAFREGMQVRLAQRVSFYHIHTVEWGGVIAEGVVCETAAFLHHHVVQRNEALAQARRRQQLQQRGSSILSSLPPKIKSMLRRAITEQDAVVPRLSAAIGIKLPHNVMKVLLPKDTPLPACTQLHLYPRRQNQKKAKVCVYQGEQLLVTDTGMALIATIISPLHSPTDMLFLTVHMFDNNKLQVTCTNTKTGQNVTENININNGV